MQWKHRRIGHLDRANGQSDKRTSDNGFGPYPLVARAVHMRGKPIHENLSTSFVDVARMVRHLGGNQFVGTLRVEFASYEAEIIFTPARKLQAREYDRLAGRISQGERAFRNILQRSREPMGRITVTRAEPAEVAQYVRKAFVDERIAAAARAFASAPGDTAGRAGVAAAVAAKPSIDNKTAALAAELIATIKEPFTRAKMDFDAAFTAARSSAAERFEFLDPEAKRFDNSDGRVKVTGKISNEELFGGVAAALSHMLANLRGDAKHAKLLVYVRHRLQQHFSSRHKEYSELGLVRTVDRILA